MKCLKVVSFLVQLACLLSLCFVLASCDGGDSNYGEVVFTNNSSSTVGPCLIEDGKSPSCSAVNVEPGNSHYFHAWSDRSYYLSLLSLGKKSNVFSVPAGETYYCRYNGSSVYCGY